MAQSNQLDLDDLFEDAINYVRLNAANLSKDKLLYLYARYKQAIEGICTGEKPSIFNFSAKSKYDAWKALKNMSKDVAMNEYVQYLNSIKPEWKLCRKQVDKVEDMSDKSTFGLKISTMTNTEAKLLDLDKSIFDWCKEGSLENVRRLLDSQSNQHDSINQTDENYMSLLMWACDRGHLHLVKYLLDNNANPNQQDIDGQTCLHYAVSCEHLEIIKLLCSSNSMNLDLADNEGLRPIEMTNNTEIIGFLSKRP
jgi:acyl-CoA-binding protein